MKNHPYGAIPTTAILKQMVDEGRTTVYLAYGLGGRSYVYEHELAVPFVLKPPMHSDFYNEPSFWSLVFANGVTSCIGDRNLDGHSCNNNYVFADRDLAEDYVAWAKENTKDHMDLFDDYYDDDFHDD
jgi:esterase/lipase superfamily enzyme